jgi:membrane-bound metal-dependent hydrolase YbcI (DUF457 family)
MPTKLMTATAHCLIAGSIVATIHNPILGVSLALISHPLLDMVPHWDVGWGWRNKSKAMLFAQASADLGLGIILAYLIFGQNVNIWYFLIAQFASVSWDVMEIPYWFFKWKFFPFGAIYKFQSGIQGKAKTAVGGIMTQVAAVALAVIVFQIILK